MRSRSQWVVAATMLALAVGWIGCGGGGDGVNEAAEAEYALLEESQEKLAELRQQLAELRAEAEQAMDEVEEEADDDPVDGEEATEEGMEEGPSLEERLETLEQEVVAASDEMIQKIATYLNEADPILEGEPLSERQTAVIRMKSAEDMVIASEYIDRGGDYRRAIRIYQDSLQLDPDNEDLKAALALAEDRRFMTEERLAEVKKGMTQTEVKELLGSVNLRNIREYPERNVVAWFYPVDESGAASAVWFRKKGAGEYAVYKTEFEQIKGRSEDEPAEG